MDADRENVSLIYQFLPGINNLLGYDILSTTTSENGIYGIERPQAKYKVAWLEKMLHCLSPLPILKATKEVMYQTESLFYCLGCWMCHERESIEKAASTYIRQRRWSDWEWGTQWERPQRWGEVAKEAAVRQDTEKEEERGPWQTTLGMENCWEQERSSRGF